MDRHLVIVCLNFPADEVQSARGLLKLLVNFLPGRCEIAGPDQEGDLYLVNLDAETPANPPEGAYVVGCSIRPREHAPGTIHRPIRPSAMLAVVSDFVEKFPGTDKSSAKTSGVNKPEKKTEDPPGGLEWNYQLLSWPLDFQQMSMESWRVLAFLSRYRASIPQIVKATELSEGEVSSIVRQLTEIGSITRSANNPNTPAATFSQGDDEPAAPPSGWRKLASKMGKLLGFGS
ncbi:hypothetical protein CO615_03105 [Lysobacteraceae bacterium NML75-0749]|nr:hypothetical protein CO611_05120 [Xanthomonadaceae bacterium NML03-0222]PJK02181.1 hypothetical protein CO615_03105 [Xanthomonadaceae bacterium NML75-0749]PJK02627.1 hypothetical protein CO609_09110 [Xanthomonadaceae bacterium NML91-0268]PJK03055.1 hypothetical protein CO612_09415 [Xanthomonadaceae bacterium NML71-0210]